MYRNLAAYLLIVLSVGLLTAAPTHAQDDDTEATEFPRAEIVNDEGGTAVVTGEANYTSPSFRALASDPVILFSDTSPLIERNYDPEWELPQDAQIVGQITSDFRESPFAYRVNIPTEPVGEAQDVDFDGEDDPGVNVLDIGVFFNITGDTYFQHQDAGTGISSMTFREIFDIDFEPAPRRFELDGGFLLVYAPDDEQGFPSGFGDDELLFTEDDPIVLLPQGWTTVNLNTDPFTFDRSREVEIPLIEYEDIAPSDFSQMSYADAFDALIEQMRLEYAFTEYKGLDWDELKDEFMPRFEAADETGDVIDFAVAMRDFTWAIPDGHVRSSTGILTPQFGAAVEGGIGIAIRDVDDGRTIVSFVTPGGPAEQAGIAQGSEIVAINGGSVDDHLATVQPWSAPFSTPDFERLQKLRYGTRFPVGSDVELTYINPGETEATTATLTVVPEPESFAFSSFNRGLTGFELPLEFELLDSGYAYVKIYSFSEDPELTLSLWDRMIQTINARGVEGLIIDMRQNGGGFGTLYVPMVSHFFEEELNLGNSATYVEEFGDFFFNPLAERTLEPPEDPSLIYRGDVAVLVAPGCQSACEFFSYAMSLEDRAEIIGEYPTSGLGGFIEYVFLPDNNLIQFTAGRSVDANGDIHIEGIGVQPTIRVPVTEETLFSEGDPILETAIEYLDGVIAAAVVDGGQLTPGTDVTGELNADERIRYALSADEDMTVDIQLMGEDDEFDTVLRLYDDNDNLIVVNDDAENEATLSSLLSNVTVEAGSSVTVEIGTFDDQLEGAFTLTVTESEE